MMYHSVMLEAALNNFQMNYATCIYGKYRVVPSAPRDPAAAPSNAVPDLEPTESGSTGEEDDGEDIAEEEAVCRICMVELSEGSGTMKLVNGTWFAGLLRQLRAGDTVPMHQRRAGAYAAWIRASARRL